MATTNINIRVDEDVKQRAEAICTELGLTLSTAVNIFLRQTVQAEGLPFSVKLSRPKARTLAAMSDVEKGKNLSGPFSDAKSLMENLNSDA